MALSGRVVGGGMLGLGAGQADSLEPVQLSVLTDVTAVSASPYHVLVLTADGTLLGWGDNSQSQLGPDLGSTIHEPTVLMSVPGARELAAGRYHSVLVVESGQVYAWGDNSAEQLGLNLPERIRRFTEHPLQGDFLSIAGTDRHSLALMSDGSVWSWGFSDFGALGLGPDWANGDATTPQRIDSLSGITQISAGTVSSMALDSAGNVWSWGSHLGSGHDDTVDRSSPEQITGLSGVTAISRGSGHGLAIGPAGVVWSWGSNDLGQLGDGTTVDSPTPVQVTGLPGPAVSISAGSWFSVVLLEDGSVWVWGDASNGLLGDGGASGGYVTVPVKSDVEGVAEVVAGFNTVWALHDDGTVSSWGANYYGQLGRGSGAPSFSSVPQKIPELNNIVTLGSGYPNRTILALDEAGVMYGWGDNNRGQLGLDILDKYDAPWRYLLEDEVTLASGGDASYAVIGGTLFVTGDNNSGSLGFGYVENSPLPQLIPGLPPAAMGY